MKLDAQQRAELAVLSEIHDEVVLGRRGLEKRIREQFEEEFDGLLRRQSRQANRCRDLGVPKTQVGRALGTTDWTSIQSILNLAAEETVAERGSAVSNLVTGDGWVYERDTNMLEISRWPHRKEKTIRKVTFRNTLEHRGVEDPNGHWHLWLNDPDNKFYFQGLDHQWMLAQVYPLIEEALGYTKHNDEINPPKEPVSEKPSSPMVERAMAAYSSEAQADLEAAERDRQTARYAMNPDAWDEED